MDLRTDPPPMVERHAGQQNESGLVCPDQALGTQRTDRMRGGVRPPPGTSGSDG
jgi:hypothetical protein